MSVIPGTLVSDPVTIGDVTANTFGSHFDFQGVGGMYCVADLTALNSIPVNPSSGVLNIGDSLSSGRRRLGMTIFVLSENKYYQLYDPLWNTYTTDLQRYNSLANNLNWVAAFNLGYIPLTGTVAGKPMNGTFVSDDQYTLDGNVVTINGNKTISSAINLVGYHSSVTIGSGDILLSASNGASITNSFEINTSGFKFSFPNVPFVWSPTGITGDDTNVNSSFQIGFGNTLSNDFSFVFGSYSQATNYVSTAVGTVVNATGQYSTAIGSYATASGVYGATAIGTTINATGQYSTAIGAAVDANGNFSTVIGGYLKATTANSTVIGTGVNSSSRLINSIANSIMLGVNSTVPSLFIGGGAGVGTFGNVGVNVTDPTARLDILAGDATKAPFKIRKNTADKATLAIGEFQFASGGRLQFSPDGITNQSIAYLSDASGVFSLTTGSINGIQSNYGTNQSLGDYAFSVGSLNKAIGLYSISMSNNNGAWGDYSFGEGNGNIVAGKYSHVGGNNSKVTSDGSFGYGYQVQVGNTIRSFTVSGTTVTITGNVTTEYTSGASVIFFALTGGTTASFVRTISAVTYNGTNTTFTINTTMTGVTSGSCVMTATYNYSAAFGFNTVAKGVCNFVAGSGSQTLASWCFAVGLTSIASGTASFAAGISCTASGSYSNAQGNSTTASGYCSSAIGVNTISQGSASHAQGSATLASGANAHAQGDTTQATGIASHSQGGYTLATNNYTHAGGFESKAELHGQFSRSGGKHTVVGDAQYSQLYCRKQTTDGSTVQLYLDGASAAIAIPSGKTWSFLLDIVGRQIGGTSGTVGTSFSVLIKGLIKNVGGVITLITSTTLADQRDASAAAWAYSVSAGASALQISVTGEINKNIDWFSIVHLTEVA
jgi:hypothetical protein